MKNDKLLALGAIVTGVLSTGVGFTTSLGHPISTVCFIGGMVLFFVGIILLIKETNTN